MPLETWLAYTLVTTTFLLIPGPTIILVISYSLLRGRQAVIALVLGVGLGDLTAMSLSFLGVGVLLQTVATAFYLIKWLGAAYLIWLGIKMWAVLQSSLISIKKTGVMLGEKFSAVLILQLHSILKASSSFWLSFRSSSNRNYLLQPRWLSWEQHFLYWQ